MDHFHCFFMNEHFLGPKNMPIGASDVIFDALHVYHGFRADLYLKKAFYSQKTKKAKKKLGSAQQTEKKIGPRTAEKKKKTSPNKTKKT